MRHVLPILQSEKNRMRVLSVLTILFLGVSSEPAITSWMFNCDGATGFGNVPSNVQEVHYDATHAYVVSTGIPSYNVGPWGPNPNTAQEQDHVFKIPLNPQAATGAHTSTPLGPIGVLSNGVPFFNALDACSLAPSLPPLTSATSGSPPADGLSARSRGSGRAISRRPIVFLWLRSAGRQQCS